MGRRTTWRRVLRTRWLHDDEDDENEETVANAVSDSRIALAA